MYYKANVRLEIGTTLKYRKIFVSIEIASTFRINKEKRRKLHQRRIAYDGSQKRAKREGKAGATERKHMKFASPGKSGLSLSTRPPFFQDVVSCRALNEGYRSFLQNLGG
jgi:hypothetical protein